MIDMRGLSGCGGAVGRHGQPDGVAMRATITIDVADEPAGVIYATLPPLAERVARSLMEHAEFLLQSVKSSTGPEDRGEQKTAFGTVRWSVIDTPGLAGSAGSGDE